MRTRPILIFVSMLVLAPSLVSAQAPADSIAAWTSRLQTGTLAERLVAAEELAGQPDASLPEATRSAILDAFNRLNRELRSGNGVVGIEELGPEDLGEYYTALATMVYSFDTPAGNRALAASAGGSSGLQRRAAKLGDEVVPILG